MSSRRVRSSAGAVSFLPKVVGAGSRPCLEATDTGSISLSRWGYRDSHERLLRDLTTELTSADDPHLPLGGIVVPASRPFGDDSPVLQLAARLADDRDASLVLVCSLAARPDDVPVWLRERLGERLVVVDFTAVHRGWSPRLRSMQHELTTVNRASEVGSKRNLGLTLARLLGWRTVLFLDDDIVPGAGENMLDVVRLRHCLRLMSRDPELRVIGFASHDFPDNSTVGHARRAAGMTQGIFIGAGCLLVRIDLRVPFFSGVYNEDWWFVQEELRLAAPGVRPVGVAGRIGQERFNPYVRSRAEWQEVGDLIGEVVMNLIEDGRTDLPSVGEWADASAERVRMIRRLIQVFRNSDDPDRSSKILVLEAARECQESVSAHAIHSYVSQLQEDRVRWKDHLHLIERWVAVDARQGAVQALVRGEPPLWPDDPTYPSGIPVLVGVER